MEYKKIAICVPTYNRGKFLPLLLYNIKNQSYPHDKLILLIDDDGTEPLIENTQEVQKDIEPIKLVYLRNNKKRFVGVKRNNLVKEAKKYVGKKGICVNMDDDDYYSKDYILFSYNALINGNYGIVGSNHMLFTYPQHNYQMTCIMCQHLRQIHEATHMYKIKYFNTMGGYSKQDPKTHGGEGAKLIDGANEKQIGNIICFMVCIAHNNNTIDKQQFWQDKLKIDQVLEEEPQKIINNCLGI